MVSDNKPTTFPNSTRVYVPGSRPDILVPMREVKLADTSRPDGAKSPNEPVRIYDTSGPWGDPPSMETSRRACRPSAPPGSSNAATWKRSRVAN